MGVVVDIAIAADLRISIYASISVYPGSIFMRKIFFTLNPAAEVAFTDYPFYHIRVGNLADGTDSVQGVAINFLGLSGELVLLPLGFFLAGGLVREPLHRLTDGLGAEAYLDAIVGEALVGADSVLPGASKVADAVVGLGHLEHVGVFVRMSVPGENGHPAPHVADDVPAGESVDDQLGQCTVNLLHALPGGLDESLDGGLLGDLLGGVLLRCHSSVSLLMLVRSLSPGSYRWLTYGPPGASPVPPVRTRWVTAWRTLTTLSTTSEHYPRGAFRHCRGR